MRLNIQKILENLKDTPKKVKAFLKVVDMEPCYLNTIKYLNGQSKFTKRIIFDRKASHLNIFLSQNK